MEDFKSRPHTEGSVSSQQIGNNLNNKTRRQGDRRAVQPCTFSNRSTFLFPLAVLLLLLSINSFAGSAAKRIIKRGENIMRGQSVQALMTMKIVRPSFIRKLHLRTWTKGRDRALVEILFPRKEIGISSLRTWNQMWNYLPKTDQVVRIPTSMMLQSWMGSDFSNDDLVKASSLVRDYVHSIVRHQGKGTKRTVLIHCRPKRGAPVVWGKILHWARIRDSLPVKQEYYDEDGGLVRTIWFTRFRKMDDRTIPTQITVKVAGNQGELTTVRYKKILYDRKIDSSIFNRHRLRQTVLAGKSLSKGWFTRPIRGKVVHKKKRTKGRARWLATR